MVRDGRCPGRDRGRLPRRLGRPRWRDTGQARAGRGGDLGLPRLGHLRDHPAGHLHAERIPLLGGRFTGPCGYAGDQSGVDLHPGRYGAGAGPRELAEPDRARRRTRHHPRHQGQPDPPGRGPRGDAPGRYGDRHRRADRLCGLGGSAYGPRHRRLGLPVDPALVDGARTDRTAARRRHRPLGRTPGRAPGRHRDSPRRRTPLHRAGPPPKLAEL